MNLSDVFANRGIKKASAKGDKIAICKAVILTSLKVACINTFCSILKFSNVMYFFRTGDLDKL